MITKRFYRARQLSIIGATENLRSKPATSEDIEWLTNQLVPEVTNYNHHR